MLLPDNFLYFILLFTCSLLAGAYLFFSYNQNRLLLINAVMFFLVAIRASTEYFLPQLDNYRDAVSLATFHSFVSHGIVFSIWYVTWFYIRPFRNFSWEKWANRIYFWGILILPLPFVAYGFYTRRFFQLHTEKIDGYWQFITNSSDTSTQILFIYSLYVMAFFTIAPMVVDLFRGKQDRLRKFFILVAYIIFPPLFSKFLWSASTGSYTIPNIGGIYFWYALSVSWFVSNYRLFQDNFSKTIKDLLESISDLAIYTDTQLVVSHTNKLTTQYFSSNIIHQKIKDVLSNVSQQTSGQIKESIDALINNQQRKKELRLIINDESKIFNLKVAKFEQGNFHLGYTFLLTDLTQIKQKEQELTQLNTTKDRLFAIIGHDLRKPALAFRGISKKVNFLIQQKEFDTLNKLGNNLERAAFSLNSLLDNLLNWALKQRDVLPYEPKPVDVQQATEEIFELFQQIAHEKKVHLQLNIMQDVKAYADPNALNTIIRNLVDNAIKYTDEGGKVIVLSERRGANILIQVKDTGEGMNDKQLSNVFALQKNKSTQGTAGEKGSGLGLTLVKDLIDLNEGTINVWSTPKQGTTFDILLPAV